MPELGPGVMPTLYEHCRKTYWQMFKESKDHLVEGGIEIVVYEGMFTALITQQLHLSTPMYTKIRAALMGMGCIRQLKRGGNNSPSRWELLREPSEEAFRDYMNGKTAPKRVGPSHDEMVDQQIRAILGRLGTLEEKVGIS